MFSSDELNHRLTLVRQRIRRACERSHRDPSSVTLICVTKGIPADVVGQAVALGITDLGENRVQEAREKQAVLGDRQFRIADFGLRNEERTQSAIPNSQSAIQVRWHLIGHLQRNKAKAAVELFDVIHSLDSVELVEALERYAATTAQGSRLKVQGTNFQLLTSNFQPLEVFVQVNVSGETTKFGCRPNDLQALARTIMRCPHLKLSGLMTMAPFSSDPETARPIFRQLRLLRDHLATAYCLLPTAFRLSMGMSQDFDVAIEEGADLIRVGTAIFGQQP